MSPYDTAVLVVYGGRRWWGCASGSWVLFADDEAALHAMTVSGLAMVVDPPIATDTFWRVASRMPPQQLLVTHLFDYQTVLDYVPSSAPIVSGLVRVLAPDLADKILSAVALSAAVAAWYQESKAADKTFTELAVRSSSMEEKVRKLLASFIGYPNTQVTRNAIQNAVERELGMRVTVEHDRNGNVVIR